MELAKVASAVLLSSPESTDDVWVFPPTEEKVTRSGAAGDWKVTSDSGEVMYLTDAEWLDMRLSEALITWDLTLYVATTGDDESGDGTSANPYQSPNKAIEVVTGKIISNCTVTIELADGTYNTNQQLAELDVYQYGHVSIPTFMLVDGIKTQGSGILKIQAENEHGATIARANALTVAILRSSGVTIDGIKITDVANTGGGVILFQSSEIQVLNSHITEAGFSNNGACVYCIEAANVLVKGCYLSGCAVGVYQTGNSKGSIEDCEIHGCLRAVHPRHSSYATVESDNTSGTQRGVETIEDQGGDVWRVTVSSPPLTQDEKDFSAWVKLLDCEGADDGVYDVTGTGDDYFEIEGGGQVSAYGYPSGDARVSNRDFGVYASRASSASTGSHTLVGEADEGTGSGGYIE